MRRAWPDLTLLLIAFAVAASVGACSSEYSNGYAVNLIIKLDPSVPDPAAVKTLRIDVSGVETTSRDFDATGKLDTREARVIYEPKAQQDGMLTFTVSALDGGAPPQILGRGSVTVQFRVGATVTTTVNVVAADCQPACAGKTPACDRTTLTCVGCLKDADCAAGELCVGKACKAGCSVTRPTCAGGGDGGVINCDVDLGVCRGCNDDKECPQSAPRCDKAKERCVPCLPSADNCGPGTYCKKDNDNYSCAAGCKDVTDCTGGGADGGAGGDGGMGDGTVACCNNACVSLSSDDNHCGACGTACGMNTCCGGQCIDFNTDANHCGGCGMACNVPGATPSCSGGKCGIKSCLAGFADCDGDASNGCEVDTTATPAHCGGCNMACPAPANGTASCANSMCGLAGCNTGFANCDNNAGNGCEVNTTTNPLHCGGCGMACPKPTGGNASCANSVCGLGGCTAGSGNCDNNSANGCETNTTNNVSHCGGCNMVCPNVTNGSRACVNSVCGVGGCNTGFGNCDNNTANGCETNTTNTAAHCGGCGMACPVPTNGAASCANSMCGLGACNTGFGNCDGNAGNGCETNTTNTAAHCGACGAACPAVANGTPGCAGSACGVGACNAGYLNCDMNAMNGCEVNTTNDPNNCASCGSKCATPTNGVPACVNSVCGLGACNLGFGNCDGNAGNGCETNTTNTVAHCGGCNMACPTPTNGSPACANSACGLGACNTGFGNCDGNAGNGCETNTTNTVAHCGGCGMACTTPANASASCVNSTCGLGACNSGFGNCDGNAQNGCETNTQTNASHCGMCGKACATGQVCASGTCVSQRRVFVSSAMYDGNLGGVAGADAKCQTLANAAGLGGSWMAWISDPTQSPSTRFFKSPAPYVLVSGAVVANNWTQLTSGTLQRAINVTEKGGAMPIGNTSCGGTGNPTVWSNTTTSGTYAGASCSNFTSTSGGGLWGLGSSTTQWTNWCSGGICTWISPIYCFEQ